VSDYNPFMQEGDTGPVEGSPAESGVAAGDGQPIDQPQEESRSYLDLDDDIAERYVRVKVDGQDAEVPLREALQGYSRTADYTRKTQELAAQRQQAEYALTVQRAIQSNPAEALGLLARQYGVAYEQPSNEGYENDYEDDDDDQFTDPLERQIREQQRQISRLTEVQETRNAQEILQSAIGGLQRRYQLDDATIRQVVGTALQNRMGPESFDMIYKNIAFDRAQQLRGQQLQQRQAAEASRSAARDRAGQLIGTGGSSNGAGGVPTSGGNPSIHEAFAAAEREHNVRF
jgi:hypothetical protein